MNQERIYIIALVVLALLASIEQIPVDAQIWGALLVIVGIVGGVMVNYPEIVQRLVIYVLSVTLPMFDDALDNIWVVGTWINMLLDNMAIGIQGMAVGLFVMALISRLQGNKAA